MRRRWLWVEDEEDSVPERLRPVILGAPGLERFENLDQLIERLCEAALSGERGDDFGFILDIMLAASPAFFLPDLLAPTGGAQIFKTGSGFDAGLVFYEQAVLGGEAGADGFFNPPPPVVFFTVRHTDRTDLGDRLDKIRRKWADAHGVAVRSARTIWFRKFEVAPHELESALREPGV